MFQFLIEILLEVVARIVMMLVVLPIGIVLSTPFVLVYGAYGPASYSANVRAAYGVVIEFCANLFLIV